MLPTTSQPKVSLPPGHHMAYDPSSPFALDGPYDKICNAVHRPRGKPQREALTAALLQLAEELAERRRRDPPLPPLPPIEYDANGEENEESVKQWEIAEAILKRRKQEEDPEAIATRALMKAHTNAFLDSNPAFTALPRATEAEVKEAARKYDGWTEGEIMEMCWEHEDNGEPAVHIFGDVGWLCPPSSFANPVPHVLTCNSSEPWETPLALWDEENGVFTNKKLVDIVGEKYCVFKLYDLEGNEE